MNLGIYIENFYDKDLVEQTSNAINKYIDHENIYDISLFFDEPGPCPFPIPCGCFNSTELWSFNGTLITTSINSSFLSSHAINDIDIYYLVDFKQKKDVFLLFELIKRNVSFIAKSEEDKKELYRLTGQNANIIAATLEETIESLLEHKDGHTKNINYVYQT